LATSKVSPNTISLFGISHSKVHQIAAEMHECKKPGIYTGKGIRYIGEKALKERDTEKKK